MLDFLAGMMSGATLGVFMMAALMATLVTTLCTFIGEGLTWQLLRNAWPNLPNQPPSEKTT